MNIGLIVDPYGEKAPGGLGRAIFEIAKALIAHPSKDTYTVYLKNKPVALPVFPRGNATVKVLDSKYLFLDGSRKLDRDLDMYVFFTPIIPLFFFPKRSIVVVHDFAYLEVQADSLKQKVLSFLLYCLHRISLSKATRVVSVSQWAKESTVEHFSISLDKIQVIYNSFFAFDDPLEPVGTPANFFLFAGALKVRKNVLGVIRGFAEFHQDHPNFFLLIAGKGQGSYYETLHALVEELGISSYVQFLGHVTDGSLAYLYTKAVALVFPSFIEGFGMPVLEAMHLSVPVITSGTGALAEVAGDAALLVDPHDPSDIAKAMIALANDPELRAKHIARGKERVKEFSWEKGGREFHALIDSATQ